MPGNPISGRPSRFRAATHGWLKSGTHYTQTNYPSSNWEPYRHTLDVVKEAVTSGDQRIVKSEMGKWFTMLRAREHGINDVAADQLYNFALMVTPIQDYGISVPSGLGSDMGY